MRLTDTEVARIEAISVALADRDWARLAALSDRPIPNFPIFLEYAEAIRGKIVPISSLGDERIESVRMPRKAVSQLHPEEIISELWDVCILLKTEEKNISEIELHLFKVIGPEVNDLNVWYIVDLGHILD